MITKENTFLPYKISELGSGVAWGDVNNDGYPDVFCGGAAGQSGDLFLNQNGKFQPIKGPWKDDASCEDKGMVFFDADGDGDLDLYVASGSNEGESSSLKDRLYLNSGDATFSPASEGTLPPFTDSSSSVSAVDFDHDGDLDLFVGSRSVPGKYPVTPQSRLLINEGGKFTEAPDDVAPGLKDIGLVNSSIWSDYNNDGWHDLVIALDWGAITVFKNEKGKLVDCTQALKLGDRLGWWRGVTAGDLDDDGDIDFVATNQGHNTKYHADAKHPHRIYYNDFDNNGVMDLVEAEYEGDTEFPVRGRSCSSCTMPFIAEKFETYSEFASASLTDIYETDIKEGPHREINYLDTSILWNEGDHFRVEPMDHLVQISPACGVQIGDFDGDSIQDILIANNFFANQPETGYMDGGVSWFVKGMGAGKFNTVWPNRSGIVLPYDTNGLAVADFDLDGDLDAVASVNNRPTSLLVNQSKNDSFNLRIRGPKSNRNSIGARVKLIGKERTRVIDLIAGGSYLSQASNSSMPVPQNVFERVEVTWPDGSTTASKLEDQGDNQMVVEYESSTSN